jgi:NADH-quinone oxidoreductase subunit K
MNIYYINVNAYFFNEAFLKNQINFFYKFLDYNQLILLSFFLFLIGLLGIVFNIHNIIVSMLCLELMFVSTIFGFIINSLTYVSFNEGWVAAFYLILVAACESAVGLGLLLLLSKYEETIDFSEFSRIRG